MAGAAPSVRSQHHKYKATDLGPSPFVDEVTGQCTLTPCDALGRARDELYNVLDEKEKVQSQSQTLIGELQLAVVEGKGAQEGLKKMIQLMEQRIRSLEQSGLNDIYYYFYDDIDPSIQTRSRIEHKTQNHFRNIIVNVALLTTST